MCRPPIGLFVLAALSLNTELATAGTSQWHASSGAFPDATCPWVLFDTASPEAPALSQGYKLTLSTSAAGENMYYEQTSSLVIPSLLTISARFRVISESHLAGNPRRGVGIAFAVGPDQANFLWVGHDEVFLWSAYATQGATALVDTDSAFHTYDIQVANQSSITVLQDGIQILTGSIVGTGGNITAPTIWWGDGTGSSFAVSEWAFFVHNANTSACGSPPVPPTVSVNDANVIEGNAGTRNATFAVYLNHPTDRDVTVGYTTTDGSATTANNDYVAAVGTLTVPATSFSTTVAVGINGDITPECGEESFAIELSSPTEAVLGDAAGVGSMTTTTMAPAGRTCSTTRSTSRGTTAPSRARTRRRSIASPTPARCSRWSLLSSRRKVFMS